MRRATGVLLGAGPQRLGRGCGWEGLRLVSLSLVTVNYCGPATISSASASALQPSVLRSQLCRLSPRAVPSMAGADYEEGELPDRKPQNPQAPAAIMNEPKRTEAVATPPAAAPAPRARIAISVKGGSALRSTQSPAQPATSKIAHRGLQAAGVLPAPSLPLKPVTTSQPSPPKPSVPLPAPAPAVLPPQPASQVVMSIKSQPERKEDEPAQVDSRRADSSREEDQQRKRQRLEAQPP